MMVRPKKHGPRAGSARTSRASRALAVVGFGAVVSLAIGCSGEVDDLKKQVDSLRTEISALKAQDGAMGERLDALEIGRGGLTTSSPQSAGDDTPELRVVKLAPPDGGDDEANAGGSRVKIRSSGGSLVQEDQGTTDDSGAPGDLRKAKELYEKKSWDAALSAYAAFVVKYPEHPKVAEATYFRGLCYAAKNDPARAAEQFDSVVKSYPKSESAPDALWELAKAKEKQGDFGGADAAKKKLKSDYPKSSAAKKLDKR